MAAAIIGLLSDPARATQMAEAAQRRFHECCSMDVIAAATLDLYQRALAG
jgi:glycosyltransferase involved in cell wall biosynthesis